MKKKKTNPNDFVELSGDPCNPTAGLTKREYFAAMAMQGILSNASRIKEENHWCKFAVIYADALIEALNKETK